MKKLFYFGILISLIFSLNACDDKDAEPTKPTLEKFDIQVKINHMFNTSALKLNEEIYLNENKDTVSFSRIVYHLNKFEFIGDSGNVSRPDKYFMIEGDDATTMTLEFDSLDHKPFHSVAFDIGVRDSVDNADGVLNSMFTDPMYWGMINGYINMKVEGRCDAVTSDSLYLLHIGGYMGDYKLAQRDTINFGTSSLQNKLGKNILTIDVDWAEYFKNPNTIDLADNNRIHAPNDSAKKISENWPSMFSFGGIE